MVRKDRTTQWMCNAIIVIAACACSVVAVGPQETPVIPEAVTDMLDAATRAPAPGGSTGEGAIDIKMNGIIEMHVKDADLFTVLQRLLRKTKTNIILGPEITGRVTASLYDVTLEEALDVILKQNGYGYIREGNFIYVKTLEELAELTAAARHRVVRTYTLNYIAPADAQTLLAPFLSAEGEVVLMPPSMTGFGDDTGGQSAAIEDIIVIRDYEEYFDGVEAQLERIDRRPRQVLLEATIVAADLTETNQLGIDFNVLGGIDFQSLHVDQPNLRNGPNATTTSTDGGGSTTTSGSDFGTLTGQVRESSLDDTTMSFATDFAGRVAQGGLSLGFVTDEVTAFLRALEEVTNTTVLANPKVLTLNKQMGKLLIGSRDGYRTLTTNQTSSTETVEFLETGIELTFRPFISDDGYVRLEVRPSDSEGSVDALGLPSENTTEVITNILVRDGHTIFIGGLFRELDTTGRQQVPIIGNIPWLGQAFGNQSDSVLKQEIIILLTVHVVDDLEAYGEYSNEVLDDSERQRVGVRRHMLGYGRSRLAHSHYKSALKELSAGHEQRALFHVDLALHNSPQLIEAIRLREDIRQQRTWEEDGSLIRDFIYNSMLRDEGLDPVIHGRVPRWGRPATPPAWSEEPLPEGLEPDMITPREVPE